MAVAVVGLLFCLFCIWMVKLYGFSRLYSSFAAATERLDAADTAVQLTPSDPEAHLIRAELLKAKNRLNEAIKEYEQAAALRPHDYILWLELGLARDEANDQEGAIVALKKAMTLAPYYAEPYWQLGNVELRAGRTEEAFADLRNAVARSPGLLPQLIDLAWAIYDGDVSAVENAIQPRDSASRLAIARFAARHGKGADAARIFRTAGTASAEDMRALLKELLAAKQFRTAYEVWSAMRNGDKRESGFNDGGFEGQLNLDETGFGWQIARDMQTVRVSIDSVQPHGGSNSLKIDWKGDSNPSIPVIGQLILVEPNSRYLLRFSARTDELVTGGPPLIAIADASANASQELARSDPFKERESQWQDYSVQFSTGRETQAVLIALVRQNCNNAPCPIFGTLWLDDFSLQKL